MARISQAIFLIALLATGCKSTAVNSSLDVKIGEATIQAAAATPTAFRLSVSYDGKPTPAQSIFLAPDPSPVQATTVQDGKWSGVKTAAGELLIDQADGLWTLRDSSGKEIIPPGPISQINRDVTRGKPTVTLDIACPSAKSFQVYGCGDGANSLLQSQAHPELGNGHAVVPYYWSPTGYAALAVGSDDNEPASWTASTESSRVEWVYAGMSADLYLMPAATMKTACHAYAELSGPAAVPPRWTFGYLQSRWGWKDRAYIDDAMHQFLSRKLPVDAFIFDFEWFTTTPDYEIPKKGLPTYTDFSFNPKLFPDPADQIAQMEANGIHFVGIRKPRLGNSELLAMARSKGWLFAQNASDRVDARNLDFPNPDVRAWYANQTIPLLQQGVAGWWDDEGEIRYNQYYWWNQSEADALHQVNPDARLWTIDRAFTPGVQRFGIAAWTGDIRANWTELAKTPTHLLNWSLAGMTDCACDIGGFGGNTTPHLLTRWIEAGVFFPVMRTHSEITVTPHFPWLWGPEAEAAIRKALDLRYQLVPYLYSLAHETYDTGLPIIRPMAMEFPDDARCKNMSDQWLLGPGLLAAPILEDKEARQVYLPDGTWYALGSGKPIQGGQDITVSAKLDEIPIYVRAGTILPMGPVLQHTDDLPGGPLEVHVYPGHDAAFTLVEDDGVSTAYLKGILRRTNFTWDDAKRTLSWTVDGPYQGKDIFTELRITVHDPDGDHSTTAPIATGGTQIIQSQTHF
jgi:alpha-glucosidase